MRSSSGSTNPQEPTTSSSPAYGPPSWLRQWLFRWPPRARWWATPSSSFPAHSSCAAPGVRSTTFSTETLTPMSPEQNSDPLPEEPSRHFGASCSPAPSSSRAWPFSSSFRRNAYTTAFRVLPLSSPIPFSNASPTIRSLFLAWRSPGGPSWDFRLWALISCPTLRL